MRVHIGPYCSQWSPYHLAELLCFWTKDEVDELGIKSKPAWVHKFGEWLAYGSIKPEPGVGESVLFLREDRKPTWLHRFLSWVNSKRKRRVYVHIDPWDSVSADNTLALIILPVLKALRANLRGAANVDSADVPETIRSTEDEIKQYIEDGTPDENFFKRWNWILDEMIFAFECKVNNDWEDQYFSGEIDFVGKKREDGWYELVTGENHTSTIDWEGRRAHQERISNGFRLFGKYYESLWD